jgi:hypothetical protein
MTRTPASETIKIWGLCIPGHECGIFRGDAENTSIDRYGRSGRGINTDAGMPVCRMEHQSSAVRGFRPT